MADRYWVGGTAAWDGTAGTKWSTTSGGAGGASVPTSADAVFFTAASTGTCTISTGNTGAQSINCTGHTGTIAGSAAISVAGGVTLVAGQTFTYSGAITFTGPGTLTTAGKTLGAVTITAGTITLGSALTCSGNLTLTGGTLTTSASNYAITVARLQSTGAISRTLTLNGSTVTLNTTSTTTAFNYTGSNLTLNAGTSTINVTGDNADFGGNGLTFNNVAFTSTTPSSFARQVTGANTFAQLTLAAPSLTGVARYEIAANQTITTFVAAGASAIRRISIFSNTPGTQRTLTVGTYTTKTDVDFRDIRAAGASAPWSGTRLGNCGGNTSITFDAAKTVYWNLAGLQVWSSTGWATTSGGTPAVNNFPLAQDTAVFDNTGAAGTVDIDDKWNIGNFSASGRTSAMTLTLSDVCNIYGNWTSGSGVSFNFTGEIAYFSGRTTQTITSAGGIWGQVSSYEAYGATITLGDAITIAGSGSQGLNVAGAGVGGGFNAATYSVTINNLNTDNIALINMGSATWTITGTGNIWDVATSDTITSPANILLSNTSTSDRTFDGANKTYAKLTIGGATGSSVLTITGTNTFTEIASTKTVAHEIIFPNVTTTVGAFTVQGSAGNVVTLSRTGATGTFTLAKSGGGIVSSDYLSISNSTATPTNTWYAGANSTNGGGNTGWLFTAAPLSRGNFLMFFM